MKGKLMYVGFCLFGLIGIKIKMSRNYLLTILRRHPYVLSSKCIILYNTAANVCSSPPNLCR